MKIYLFRRTRHGVQSPYYSYRFKLHGKYWPRQTQFTNKDDARRKAQAHILALEKGVHEQVSHLFTRRQAATAATIGQLLTAHERIGQGKAQSAHGFRQQLRNILRQSIDEVGRGSRRADDFPLSNLSAALVRAYKSAVERAIAGDGASDQRAAQMQRTANSTLSHARALFSDDMLARYRDAGLVVPESIQGFRTEPLFKKPGRTLYHLPADTLIRDTLADLDRQRDAHRNLYLAVWLIIGFGLRKSELAGLRRRDLEQIRGRWHAVICETWPGRTRCTTTKNRDTAPKVPVANNAWMRLAPFLDDLPPDAYVLAGEHLCDRLDYVARDISAWMRGLGWKSQKTMHELRSWAICQIGYAAQAVGMDPLETMRGWARHGSRSVTEKHYGRYFTNTAPDAPLTIPDCAPAFVPRLVAPPMTIEPPASQVADP